MNILVRCVAGSHLFGTNTPKSDKDFKGVYLPTLRDCVTGEVKHSINQKTNNTGNKNTSEDIDVEFYSAQKFFKMLEEGQTVALELLFTPEQFIIEKSPLWDRITENRDKLVHRNIKAFIGYARQQADRYGLMGSKINEIDRMITILDKMDQKSKLGSNKDDIVFQMPTNFCKFETINNKGYEYNYLVINGKKFDLRTSVEDTKHSLILTSQAYGDRARQAAKNEGIDWKAISHAVRVCHQGIELLNTGKITLPLTAENGEEVLEIKSEKWTFEQANTRIMALFTELNNAYAKSNLRDNIDTEMFLLELYGNTFE